MTDCLIKYFALSVDVETINANDVLLNSSF